MSKKTIRTTIIQETRHAILIRHQTRDIWLPKSVVTMTEPTNMRSLPRPVDITAHGWLLKNKGLV